MLGPNAALPALIAGAAPFYARMAEIALREIDKGVIEASQAMGASSFTIIRKVLIPEAMPALISGITVTAIACKLYGDGRDHWCWGIRTLCIFRRVSTQ